MEKIMTKITKVVIIVAACLVVLGAVFYAGYHVGVCKEPIIQEVVKEKIVFKTVPVDVNTLDIEALRERLNCYYNFPPIIDYKVKEISRANTTLNIHTVHCESEWSQDIKVPVYQEGNWKLYVGIGIGTAVTVGAVYGGMKLVEAMKK